MALQATTEKRVFHFGFDARTSRGAMRDKASWLIKVFNVNNPEVFGLGECGPLPGLSPELTPEFEAQLLQIIDKFNAAKLSLSGNNLNGVNDLLSAALGEEILKFSSVIFAFETALLDLSGGGIRSIFPNEFLFGKPIPINGLIWMGGLDFMLQQIEIKIRDGFKCVKLKVGGIDFEKECDVLQYIRRKYFRDQITIRLDANGAFKPADVAYKLNELAKFGIHSIEQPLKPGAPELAELCLNTPIPIALDEELIGVAGLEQKEHLIKKIKPQYIILKPTLHGGMRSCKEWISIAEKNNVGWWITSALESNVGLNAIAQFTAEYPVTIPQGLGTGTIYTDNIESPLIINRGNLSCDNSLNWVIS